MDSSNGRGCTPSSSRAGPASKLASTAERARPSGSVGTRHPRGNRAARTSRPRISTAPLAAGTGSSGYRRPVACDSALESDRAVIRCPGTTYRRGPLPGSRARTTTRGDVAHVDRVQTAGRPGRQLTEQDPAQQPLLLAQVGIVGTEHRSGVDGDDRRAVALEVAGDLLRRDLRLDVRTAKVAEREVGAGALPAGQRHRAGHVHDRVAALLGRRPEHQPGSGHVALEHLRGPAGVEAEHRGSVHDRLAPGERLVHRLGIEDVADDQVLGRL